MFALAPLLSGEGRAHHGEILREATRLVEAGAIVPNVDPRRFGMDSIGEAYAAITSRTAHGKVVIDVAASW